VTAAAATAMTPMKSQTDNENRRPVARTLLP